MTCNLYEYIRTVLSKERVDNTNRGCTKNKSILPFLKEFRIRKISISSIFQLKDYVSTKYIEARPNKRYAISDKEIVRSSLNDCCPNLIYSPHLLHQLLFLMLKT